MRHLPKILAFLVTTNMLGLFAKADLPPGTLELIRNNEEDVLDLSGQGLGSDDVKGLGKELEKNIKITTLILADNYLDNSCQEEIISIMSANNTLQELDLGGNYIGGNCLKYIIERVNKKCGICWKSSEKVKYYLTRNLEVKKVSKTYIPEDVGDKPATEVNNFSERRNQRKQTQVRAQKRLLKEMEIGTFYDQE